MLAQFSTIQSSIPLQKVIYLLISGVYPKLYEDSIQTGTLDFSGPSRMIVVRHVADSEDATSSEISLNSSRMLLVRHNTAYQDELKTGDIALNSSRMRLVILSGFAQDSFGTGTIELNSSRLIKV